MATRPGNVPGATGATTEGNGTPVLWGVDEDDGQLFSIADYTKIANGAAAAGFKSYGALKYDRSGRNNLRDIGPEIEAMDLAADGIAYLGYSRRLTFSGRPSLAAPVVFRIDTNAVTTAGPNVVQLVGRIPIGFGAQDALSGLAVHAQTGRLFALHRVGGTRNIDRLLILSAADARVVANLGEIRGIGSPLKCEKCEDLNFDSSGRLYVTDDYDDHVDELDPATGKIIALVDSNVRDGLTGVSSGLKIEALAWDERAGGLLGFDDTSGQFVSVSPGTGHNRTVGRIAGLTDVEGFDFFGSVVVDGTAPVIDARLANDTASGGTANSDRVTSDPSVAGTAILSGRFNPIAETRYVMSPAYRMPTPFRVAPVAVKSARAQRNSTPNRFRSTSRFPPPGIAAPGAAGTGGCIASNSLGKFSMWIGQTFV